MAKQKKQFLLFGLGKFGMSIAKTIAKSNNEILAVDMNQELIEDALEFVTHAVKADVTDKDALEALGIEQFDVAINAIGSNLEASIMATLLLKEYGVKHIIAKATTDMHEKVLEKIGADKVIQPEKEMGVKIGGNLISDRFFEFIELSEEYSIVEIETLEEWVGKSLAELNIRAKYKINVIAIKHTETDIEVSLDPEYKLKKGERLMILGNNEILEKLEK